MKNLFKYSIGVLFAGLAMTACSPDEFDGANPNNVPTTDGVNVSWDIDEETNTVAASVDVKEGTYPVWYIHWPDKNDTTGLKPNTIYSTLSEFSRQFVDAGTYTLELRIANRNGFSNGKITKEVTFAKTAVDWSGIIKRLAGKEWRISKEEQGHLGCGPCYTDGTSWWTAGPNEKKDNGVYDDRIIFNEDGTYTYLPGDDGLVFVNKDVTALGGAASSADRDEPVQAQTAKYSFKSDFFTPAGATEPVQTNYLVLDDNTLFPYISSDQQYQKPVFRIESYSNTKLVLVYDNPNYPDPDISWHYILTSQEAVPEFEGFKVDSEFNLFKGANIEMGYYYAPGWAQIADPVMTHEGNSYSFALPEATSDRWQAQVAFNTDIAVNAATNYDFSVILNASKAVKAMVKLTQRNNDDNFFFAEEVQLEAGQEYIFWKSDMPGIDAPQLKLVLDFGGNQEGTDVEVRNLVLKDHANDDGTVLPDNNGNGGEEPGGGDTMDWDYDSAANLWKAVDDGSLFDAFGYYFADDGWGAIDYTEATHSGDTYEIDLPEGLGGTQWQGQFHIDTKLTAKADKKYNFYLVMETDADCPQVTFKLTDSGDNNFFFQERVDVKADGFVFKREGLTLAEGKDADAIRMFFDFGGSPGGTHVKISKIYFEEAVSVDYDDPNNLWKAVDDGSLFDTFGYWFADDGWGELAVQPVATHSGDTYTIELPEGMGASQWQGQFHIDTKQTAKGSSAYNIAVTLEADDNLSQVTLKLTDSGDNNFFFQDRKDVTADTPTTFVWKGATLAEGKDADALRFFFDFGGSPSGTTVKISKITLIEVK